ncbi:hypothetical protein EC957_001568 [Mortierella hygrophila]|uniref:BUB1 N-terminal domain-containing protein n=1 Tax=Mortierella hygrophila TaxID=979708 RepID=A0A9P6FG46_9FUNG|nr:hypothetical protein EC957_001568 [Mortierella hygrophila]
MQQQHTHNGLRRDSFSPPPASDTSFSSVVVDIDAIELEKENIQPLRQGRSALTLARLFTTQHDDRAQQQAVMHGRFQAELAHIDDLDDPMDVYSRYVKWMIENYPQSAGQGNDSQLSPVLERALTDFKDDERYRNDPRFVKLLIIYSEKISNTIELFNYMEANGIGSEIAMYYEEFADFLESREEFDRAREVFVTGINRRARPLGRLKKQYEDFERRAQVYKDELELEAVTSARSTSVPPQQHPQVHSAASSSSGESQRRVLGVKVTGTQSIYPNASAQGHVSVGQERSTSTANSGTRNTGSSGPSRPNAKLQVYTDQPSQSSVPTKLKATSKSLTSQASTPWRDFGAEQVRRKENTREVTSWKGATLSSEDTIPRRLLPKLEVYRDPEEPSPPPTPSTRTSSFSDENKPPSPLAPAPAKHIPIITTVLDDAQSHSSHTHPTSNTQQTETHDRGSGGQKFPVTINANGRAERLMIDLTDIYVNDEEFSIEEIKARRYRYSWRHTNNLSVSSNSKQSPSASPPLPAPPPAGSSAKHYRDDPVSEPAPDMPPQKKAQPDKEQDSLSTPYRSQAPSLSVKELLPQSPSDEERHFFGSRRRLTASPTMNTKYASEEMNRIFSDRSRTRRSIDSQWSAEDTQDVGRNELDNFTMAYSIPNLPPLSLPPFSRYLDSEIVNEFEDDDDQAVRTEGFVTRLENGYSSTITQDIAALKRRRAEEMALGDSTRSSQGNRLSFREGNRLSSKFDPFRTQESDITIAIRQRTQQLQQKQDESTEGNDNARGTFGYLRSSLGRSSIGSLSSAQRRYGSEGGGQRSIERTGQDELESPFIFKDGGAGLDVGMTVPMLEDEAPPAFINDLPYT